LRAEPSDKTGLKPHLKFRVIWWISNLLLAAALVSTVYGGLWEMSVRRYLRGFSDAIVPAATTSQQKVEAILRWMLNGPPRLHSANAQLLSAHNPEDTLNYQDLMAVCGSATNAFLNLSRSAGVPARRLLLLAPDRTAKHVVAEVKVDDRWVVVDATYRTFMKDAKGNLLTRTDLQNPEMFREATSVLANYSPEYTYERFAHVRLTALPFHGMGLRQVLDRLFPNWEEYLDWTLLLERRSFFAFFISIVALLFLMIVRLVLGWVADHRLRVPRFHLWANLSRAAVAFFTSPEIK
jgi:transglutaminase-like putative cysteine protease